MTTQHEKSDNIEKRAGAGFAVFAAPLQGFTEAVWRKNHAALFGGIDAYYMPFMRVEDGRVRDRDLRDLLSPLNEGVEVVPQAIFRDAGELSVIVDAVAAAGFRRLDLNMGCPHPPQTSRGRGCGFVPTEEVGELLRAHRDFEFSVKMRLGMDEPGEWHSRMDWLNGLPLRHVTLHPRTARQRYRGNLHLDEVGAFLDAVRHPVIFNGDVRSADDVARIRDRWPEIAGVMLGRGLLCDPWLALSVRGRELTLEDKQTAFFSLHRSMLEFYKRTLCGDAQVLMKIKPLWDYAGVHLSKKSRKAIKKATRLVAYESAVASARFIEEPEDREITSGL